MHPSEDFFLSYDLAKDRASGDLKYWKPGKGKLNELDARLGLINKDGASRREQFLSDIASVVEETMAKQNEPVIAGLDRLQQQVRRPDLVKYTVEEATSRLKRSRSSIYALIQSGEIVPVKEQGRTYITEEECQRFERNHRNQ